VQSANTPEALTDEARALALPAYDDAWLAALSPPELIDLLRRDQDRAPRNVIDECARRGGVMLNEFAQLLHDEARYWSDDTTDGDWWLHMHAIRTLGLMASERAGDMLLAYIQQMDDAADESQQDWHSGHWPALFANKPDSLTAPLLDYVRNRAHSPFSRFEVLQAVLARACAQGEAALDNMLDTVARLAKDTHEPREMRMLFGYALLDFPRPRHRALLQKLARSQQQDDMPLFDFPSVTAAFIKPPQAPRWVDMDSPWKFYEPTEITERQQRWLKEKQAANAIAPGAGSPNGQMHDGDWPPLARTTPKVGRNDPCPCGSGKKYKKCCLHNAA
jgi:hypothetical protein